MLRQAAFVPSVISTFVLFARRDRYTIRTAPGVTEVLTGAYVLNDGGYHQWRATMCASNFRSESWFQDWSRRLGSVRKDIEDVFGVLKGALDILHLAYVNSYTESCVGCAGCAAKTLFVSCLNSFLSLLRC